MCEGGVRSSDMIMLTARALVSFAYQQLCIVRHSETKSRFLSHSCVTGEAYQNALRGYDAYVANRNSFFVDSRTLCTIRE